MLDDVGPMAAAVDGWHHGYLFAPALTIGGGTGDVQRNILAERVLGLPHDTDATAGLTWAEAHRIAARRLDLHDLRPGVDEELARIGPRDLARQLEHAQAGEGKGISGGHRLSVPPAGI